ncbi:MAG: hypothetical protein WC180_05365 [Candidatus Paceibacterota bacterium]
MTSRFTSYLGKLSLCLSVLFFFSAVPFCGATVNKDSVSVLVHTASEDNWYDYYSSVYYKNTNPLHTFASCDYTSYTTYEQATLDRYYKNSMCDGDGKRNDYLYTDSADEAKTYPVSENFTITASASASSGSMSGVKIEWVYGLTALPNYDGSSWTTASNGIGSYTCPKTGTCTICVKGGTCAHPVIPQEALSVHDDGEQRRFFFRVTFTSSGQGGDSVTTGYDNALDKYYALVICGPKCASHTCDQYTPSISTDYVTSPGDFCSGLNDVNGYYTVNWEYLKIPSHTTQDHYKISIRKKGTTNVLKTYESDSSSLSYKIPSSWLSYGISYEWMVEADLSGQGCNWSVVSPWSSGAANIVVPNRYPVPKMTVKNAINNDCLNGGCLKSEDLKFDGSASSFSTGSPSYDWTIDGNPYKGVSLTENFISKKHTVKLKITDGAGNSCSTPVRDFDLDQVAQGCLSVGRLFLVDVYKPANPCGGLDNDDGYYAVTWKTQNIPANYKQVKYVVTVENKNNSADTHTISVASSSTMFLVPAEWITYGSAYKWKVKITVSPANNVCSLDVESSWSDAYNKDIIVPQRYPEPEFDVENAAKKNCLINDNCYKDESLKFDAKASRFYDGTPKYDWVVDGGSYTGVDFSDSFTKNNFTATLKVTDGAGNFCTLSKPIYLAGTSCSSAPTVSLLPLATSGDFCGGMVGYRLSWQNNGLPAGATQTNYDITIQNRNIAADTRHLSGSNATMDWIPTGWLDYDSAYDWQVKTTTVSADGSCTWTSTSTWSSGAISFSIPKQYPIPRFSVENSVEDCLDGGCFTGENIEFDARASEVFVGTPTYKWTLDGNSDSREIFSESFSDVDHTVGLEVTDGAGHSCFIPAKSFSLDGVATAAKPTWGEIAPY